MERQNRRTEDEAAAAAWTPQRCNSVRGYERVSRHPFGSASSLLAAQSRFLASARRSLLRFMLGSVYGLRADGSGSVRLSSVGSLCRASRMLDPGVVPKAKSHLEPFLPRLSFH
ncbi:hypothetical protein AOLI_G00078800 [Acnodon oligacanthus]